MEEELNRPAFSRCTGQNSPGGNGVPTESCGDQNFLKSRLGERVQLTACVHRHWVETTVQETKMRLRRRPLCQEDTELETAFEAGSRQE